MPSKKLTSATSELVLQMRNELEALSAFSKEAGYPIRPFDDADLPHFSLHAYEQQTQIVKSLREYCNLVRELKAEGVQLNQNLNLLWRALARLGFVPCKDLFSQLTEEDVVEIYDRSSLQLYRSFSFFGLCSYSLEELYSRPWFELYHREEKFHEMNLGLLHKFVSGQLMKTEPTGIPMHEVRELKAPKMRSSMIQPHLVSPLFDNSGQTVAILSAFKVVSVRKPA